MSTIRLGIAPSATTVPATCVSRSSVRTQAPMPATDATRTRTARQGEVVPAAPRCSTALPQVVVDRLRPQVVGDAVQGGAEFVGHASAPISSASSGASARSRARAWRVVDFTVPVEMPSGGRRLDLGEVFVEPQHQHGPLLGSQSRERLVEAQPQVGVRRRPHSVVGQQRRLERPCGDATTRCSGDTSCAGRRPRARCGSGPSASPPAAGRPAAGPGRGGGRSSAGTPYA